MEQFTFKILIVLCYLYGVYPEEPLVQIEDGLIRGTTLISRKGRQFEAYKSIPYAKPPVGNLRFKSPKKVRPWNNTTLDATKEAPMCIQKSYLFANPKLEGQEDCLYLNVFAPKVVNSKLPVMVSIHWGGFFMGSGTSDYFSPEYIMDKDVILVTFNYRLGILGFLSTLDDEAPGNYGLKDQVAVLKWVQKNIASFQGDPGNVTIFGASAGGGSAHLHILSPLSKGLFHRAISQSGSALALWATPLNDFHKQILKATALIFQCNLNNTKDLIKCLKKVDAKDLVESGDTFKYFFVDPLNPYTLVIESKTHKNKEPFLTKRPLDYIQAKEFQNVPWIIGAAQNEGALRASPMVRNSTIREALNKNYTQLMKLEMLNQLSVPLKDVTSLHKNIHEFYMKNQEFINAKDAGNIQGFTDLWSDRAFNYPTYQSVMLHSALGHSPIWMYTFEYKGRNTYENIWAATNETVDFSWGGAHCDDQLYLFNSPALFQEKHDETDEKIRETILERWTNFAISGSPQRNSGENEWKCNDFTGLENMKNENLVVLNITGSAGKKSFKETMQNGFYKERMLFWASQPLFENFKGLQ